MAWWVYGLAAVALVLYPLGLVARLRCEVRGCSDSVVEQAMDLDALGGLPRLFTTGLFVGLAVLAWLAVRRSTGSPRLWWASLAAIGIGLAVAKLVSVHSIAKASSVAATFGGGLLVTVVALGVLWVSGRRWAVAATVPVVVALGTYATAALGLDLTTSLLIRVQETTGDFTEAAAVFVEEFGEALTALGVLVTVRWTLPIRRSADPAAVADQSVRQQ